MLPIHTQSGDVDAGSQQLGAQSCELLLILTPLSKGRVIDWTPHLRGTRRGGCGWIPVELEAAIFPLEAARRQQSPALFWRIGDQSLVRDLVNDTRHTLLPMVHETPIPNVIPRDVIEII